MSKGSFLISRNRAYPREQTRKARGKSHLRNFDDFNENPKKYKTIDDKQNILFKNLQNNKKVKEGKLEEAEYQGRKVKLGKPMQGDVKKFKVYVKNPAGNVVKVNFGHGGSSAKGKTMKIRKSNPEARKNFRARHNCDTPGPRHKARYWSCRKW